MVLAKINNYGIYLKIGDILKYRKEYLESNKNLFSEISGKVLHSIVFFTMEDAIKGTASKEVIIKCLEVSSEAEYHVKNMLKDIIIVEIVDNKQKEGYMKVLIQETYTFLHKSYLYIYKPEDHTGMIQAYDGEWRWF